MQQRSFDLADLLTASGAAMASSNQRLAAAGAPALLREFTLNLGFSATFKLAPCDVTVQFAKVSQPNAQMQAMSGGSSGGGNVTINATYIAAPTLKPPPGSGGGDP